MDAMKHWYLIEPLARMALRSGDPVARKAVTALADAMLSNGLRDAFDAAVVRGRTALVGDDQNIDATYCARQLLTLIDEAEQTGEVKDWPVHLLYRTGGITLNDLRAAQEIRWAAEVGNAYRLRAVDPGKLAVDGGRLGPFAPLAGVPVGEWSALAKVRAWAVEEGERADQFVRGSRQTVTTLHIVGEVVVNGRSMRALDKLIGVRNGTSADIVKRAIRRCARVAGPAMAT
ncbi:hypothetical protein GAY33_05185 [Azospirillum brasilense]|uniref:hypothetical protein n=1 Tax=Azospirillum argentinense TaxID=2970906 RepID=UPI00190BA47C|nr:hypothetical protein [Azospirillum argentinense]MBK3798630.1 hypothetical protein [Azospirillum argentinense]